MIEKEMNLGKEVFVADSFGNVFRKIKGYQGKEEASSEIFAGDFWKMIKNSKVVTVKKTKEAMAGDFWKMVEFTENLQRKRETMRRLSASKRAEEEELAPSAAAPTDAAPRNYFRTAPHYDSQQLGAARAAKAPHMTGSGVALVALRKKKTSVKPQQC